MAKRRMFSNDIVRSDAFLNMPLSSQALYFHLGMDADDEGILSNVLMVQRIVGASQDDVNILLAKKFLIQINDDNGNHYMVIKHWSINNYIQKDRFNSTRYPYIKEQLVLDDNGTYHLKSEHPELVHIESDEKVYKNIEIAEAKDNELTARELRNKAYKESDLPYSFCYKIRQAFIGQKCPICGKTMSSNRKENMPTIQHNVPISLGGKHELDNISVICEHCNTSISNRKITEPLNTELVKEIWENINHNGNVSGLDTQVRLGKSKSKVSIGNNIKENISNDIIKEKIEQLDQHDNDEF